ncbi:MAG: nicotinate-nicotinamide nucleotide adenylyltransferase [Alphaproteobacteria bacterium]|nr:nicotinate-nicotinamide nucleotide adenylyltransferase [Alphaproteobacteria bacterium]
MSLFSEPHLLDSPRWKNMRVGLLGGSFNPPHEGHVHISLMAMRALALDSVWWLVTPQNPIKELQPLPLEERMRLSRELIDHPKILVSDIEKDMGTSITYHTIRRLRTRYPHTQFVWISGMDNALGLHKWNHWQGLLNEICMVHLARPPMQSLIRNCPLKMLGTQRHIHIDHGGQLPLDSGTTYWMMQKKMVKISSTEIRKEQIKLVA